MRKLFRRCCALLGAAVLLSSAVLAQEQDAGGPPDSTATAGQLNIHEFRLVGPNGQQDEFIEIYNASGASHTVLSSDSSAGYAVAASDGAVRFTIPNGTVIPARGHFLGVNSVGYSLGSYATGDTTYTNDIPDDAGIALFNTANSSNFNLAHRLDAVGPSSEANTLYREGTGYPPLTPFLVEGSFFRITSSGNPQDTNNNVNDFMFADTDATNVGAGQRLGAPGPENLSSPIQRNTLLPATIIDPQQLSTAAPNRVRDLTSNPANNSTFGTLSVRRRFTNNTGANVTRLRFRVVDIATYPSSGSGIADVRALASGAITVTLTDGTSVSLQALTLEQPPAQPNGGGYNATLALGSITPSNPLPPGASVSVQFLLGVQQTGSFRFAVNIEALP